jgi:hypothetical protein
VLPLFFIWLKCGIQYCKDTTNRSSYQDKASKIGGRLNQKPNVYSLLMLKVRFRGNLLQRTSQILTYRHVDRIFTFFSIYPFKRNDKQIEEYRCKSFYSFQFIFLISIWKGTKKVYMYTCVVNHSFLYSICIITKYIFVYIYIFNV